MNKLILNLNDILGEKLYIEDAILLRQEILKEISNKKVILNFQNISSIPNNFFSTLLVPLQEEVGWNTVLKNLDVINLEEEEKENYNRVYYGTSNN